MHQCALRANNCHFLRGINCEYTNRKDSRTVMAMMIVACSGVTKVELNLHCVLRGSWAKNRQENKNSMQAYAKT